MSSKIVTLRTENLLVFFLPLLIVTLFLSLFSIQFLQAFADGSIWFNDFIFMFLFGLFTYFTYQADYAHEKIVRFDTAMQKILVYRISWFRLQLESEYPLIHFRGVMAQKVDNQTGKVFLLHYREQENLLLQTFANKNHANENIANIDQLLEKTSRITGLPMMPSENIVSPQNQTIEPIRSASVAHFHLKMAKRPPLWELWLALIWNMAWLALMAWAGLLLMNTSIIFKESPLFIIASVICTLIAGLALWNIAKALQSWRLDVAPIPPKTLPERSLSKRQSAEFSTSSPSILVLSMILVAVLSWLTLNEIGQILWAFIRQSPEASTKSLLAMLAISAYLILGFIFLWHKLSQLRKAKYSMPEDKFSFYQWDKLGWKLVDQHSAQQFAGVAMVNAQVDNCEIWLIGKENQHDVLVVHFRSSISDMRLMGKKLIEKLSKSTGLPILEKQ